MVATDGQNPRIRVLLVDDEQLIRTGFAMILNAQPDITVVGEASDGATALSMTAALTPHVVLMDIRMPGLDGIQATSRLITTHPSVKVVVLTTFDMDDYVARTLRAGASGFLLKRMTRDELVAAVRVVHRGDALLDPSVTRRMLDRLAHAAQPTDTAAAARLTPLTSRERDVLTQVARGLSNREIAPVLHVSEHTVKTHVSSILTKLGLRDRAQAVVLAYDTGLAQPGQ